MRLIEPQTLKSQKFSAMVRVLLVKCVVGVCQILVVGIEIHVFQGAKTLGALQLKDASLVINIQLIFAKNGET
jgi:hypothetical protein